MGELVPFPKDDVVRSPRSSSLDTWLIRHHEAIQSPRGIEVAVTDMRRALLRFCVEHQERYESPLGQDCVLSDCWLQMARGYLGMLNGETGRLDCGTLDHELRSWADRYGFTEEL